MDNYCSSHTCRDSTHCPSVDELPKAIWITRVVNKFPVNTDGQQFLIHPPMVVKPVWMLSGQFHIQDIGRAWLEGRSHIPYTGSSTSFFCHGHSSDGQRWHYREDQHQMKIRNYNADPAIGTCIAFICVQITAVRKFHAKQLDSLCAKHQAGGDSAPNSNQSHVTGSLGACSCHRHKLRVMRMRP